MKIFKYEITTTDSQQIEMPRGATILTVQVQYANPCLWALVAENADTELRTIRVFVTGHDVPRPVSMKYIGTYQLNEGSFIGHVFEEAQA